MTTFVPGRYIKPGYIFTSRGCPRRVGTYTLKSETGLSLVAAGWRLLWEVKGRSWNGETRPRVDKAPLQDKFFWGSGDWEGRRPAAAGAVDTIPGEAP